MAGAKIFLEIFLRVRKTFCLSVRFHTQAVNPCAGCGSVARGPFLAMKRDLVFSIIIANYNYGRYVGDAIDSALGQDWPHVEVIVVDDGSTDDSAQVIAGYGDRITAVLTENRGQREANNTGFSISHGDIVIFLDSDDVLLPSVLREIAAVWREGLSKVQVMMQRVDSQKRPNGGTVPKMAIAPPPERIRQWVDATFEYPTPPSSANAWSRAFLNAIFPLDGTHDAATDSTCIAMAPYMGDIVTIPLPLVLYRMHGANDSTMTARDTNYSREVARGMKRLQAAQNACRIRGVPPPPSSILFSGGNLLQFRVASLRLTPKTHPLPGDSRVRAVFDALLLPFRPSFQRLSTRIMIVGWSVLTLLAPARLARVLVTRPQRWMMSCPIMAMASATAPTSAIMTGVATQGKAPWMDRPATAALDAV